MSPTVYAAVCLTRGKAYHITGKSWLVSTGKLARLESELPAGSKQKRNQATNLQELRKQTHSRADFPAASYQSKHTQHLSPLSFPN